MVDKEITVEVVYALPHEQLIISTKTHEGTTAEQVIKASGILSRFPEIDLSINRIGIFGKLSHLVKHLRHLDRVEIYRALLADPKEIRKQRIGNKIKGDR